MPTRIEQIDDTSRGTSTLRVEGELLQDDARLIEKIAVTIRDNTGNKVLVDVADLDFMDSEAAPILRRLDTLDDITLVGMEIFLQTIINDAERQPA